MKMLSTLALSALLLVPVTAAQALDIKADVCVQVRQNNSCAIDQAGTHNFARSRQIGETNKLEIRQTGEHNDAKARQTGGDNDVVLRQRDRH